MRRAITVPNEVVLKACGVVSSTMDVSREWFRDGSTPMPFGVLAESQIAGRGHGQRSWLSEKGNLLITFAIPQSYVSETLSTLLPVVTVLAVRRAAMMLLKQRGYLFTPDERLDKHDAKLEDGIRTKWINDLVFDKRKLGGILIEAEDKVTSADGNVALKGAGAYLIGIGVNLVTAPEVQDGGRASSSLTEVARGARGRLGVVGAEEAEEPLDPTLLAQLTWSELATDLQRMVDCNAANNEEYLRRSVLQEMSYTMDWGLDYVKRTTGQDGQTAAVSEVYRAVSLDPKWGTLTVKRKDGTGDEEKWLFPAD